MGILQKKCRTTGKKALAYRGKGGQNTGTAFPALRLRVVLYLLNDLPFKEQGDLFQNGPEILEILEILEIDNRDTRVWRNKEHLTRSPAIV